MAPLGGVVDAALPRALEVREGLRGASELHAGTDIVSPCAAEDAALARQSDFQGDPVSRFKLPGRVRPDGFYYAGRLVAEGERLPHKDVSVAVVVEVMLV